MAKKQAAAVKKAVIKKAVVKKKVAIKQVAPAAKAKKTAAKRTVRVKTAATKVAARGGKRIRQTATLGRPRVPADSRLDLLFHKDYEAREIFEFLRVGTIKELETHSPGEIVERLTAPVVKTVDRIRKAMALNNRCLAGDQQFAIEFQRQFQQQFGSR
jgi:hypothetical protein